MNNPTKQMAQYSRIADRFLDLYKRITGYTPEKVSVLMDLESADHAVKLDLNVLESFKDEDFLHDLAGICNHMDRSEFPGKMDPTFLPRCAR